MGLPLRASVQEVARRWSTHKGPSTPSVPAAEVAPTLSAEILVRILQAVAGLLLLAPHLQGAATFLGRWSFPDLPPLLPRGVPRVGARTHDLVKPVCRRLPRLLRWKVGQLARLACRLR